MLFQNLKTLIAVALLCAMPLTAVAANLRIGVQSIANTMDPYAQTSGQSADAAVHVFDTLLRQDKDARLSPALATSLTNIDPHTWELKLRNDVKFHDGSPFSADDVKFSLWRLSNVPNSDSPFRIVGQLFSDIEVKDPYTLTLKTVNPEPLLPWQICYFSVISKKYGEQFMESKMYNDGQATIGTGPYLFKDFLPGQHITFVKNPNYWGTPPVWDSITMIAIEKPESRVAALMAGDVDLINDVPAEQLEQLRSNANLTLWEGSSNTVRFLIMDQSRDQALLTTDKNGNDLPDNPFKNAKVRAAISHAINRDALIKTALEGLGIAASQLLNQGFFGVDPDLKPDAYNPVLAKQLLAEAGYPDGFKVTLNGSTGHYYNAPQVVETIGQMLARIGISTEIALHPRAQFAEAGRRFEYSFAMFGWGSDTGEVGNPLKALIHTNNPEMGTGVVNRGRYSNPEVDKAIADALAEFDSTKREGMLQKATRMAMEDHAIIPLYYGTNIWASHNKITFEPRFDARTSGREVAPK